MAVALDAQSFKDLAGTGGTFTHSPVGGTPQGIAVLLASNAATTDTVTAVSYGGAALSRVAFMSGGAASEPGAAYLYFKGSGVASSGTVNVITTTGTSTAWAVTVDALKDTEFGGTATVTSTSLANPSGTVTVTAGLSLGMMVGVLFSGANAPASNAVNSGYTALTGSAAGGRDFGSQSAVAAYGAKASAGSPVAMGWTNSTADDVALIVGLIREISQDATITGVRAVALGAERPGVPYSPPLLPDVNFALATWAP